MKINPVLKQYFTESILKASFKFPSRFNLPPTVARFTIEQLARVSLNAKMFTFELYESQDFVRKKLNLKHMQHK